MSRLQKPPPVRLLLLASGSAHVLDFCRRAGVARSVLYRGLTGAPMSRRTAQRIADACRWPMGDVAQLFNVEGAAR